MKQLISIFMVISLLGIVGCHSSGGDNNPPPAPQNRLSELAAQALDSEPEEIANDADLQADIAALFGPADGEPVAINPGDDIQAVLDRASGN
ncbi:MAG TPA: hypothetical protein EYH06_06180 [Chromatiales bacterium]|nr:hypothetical protein [Thiotrichales bacterium]HIP68167.1 hypothetical protein [Chromatiales bacterium]